jgi:acetyltransferase
MHRLDRLLAPRSVAVLIDAERSSVGLRVLEGLLAARFDGPIHAVGRSISGLPGVRAHADLGTLGTEIDLAVIATGHAELAPAVRACADRGVGAAVILPSPERGFGREGAGDLLGRALVAEATAAGMRLVGPNSFGLVRPGARLRASLASPAVLPGSIALVVQSGGVCAAIVDWAAARNVGFSAVVSLGDAVDLDFGEVLEFLALDAPTTSVLLHVESVRSARAFLSGLRLAARMKPVVVVKTGAGGAATGGADDAFDAALARSGAVRVSSIAQMFAAAQFLSNRQRVDGNRLAIVSNSHGLGIAAADWAAQCGVAISPPSPGTVEALRTVTAARRAANPVELHPYAEPAHFEVAVKALLADAGLDGVLALLAPNVGTDSSACAAAVVLASERAAKPVLASWVGGVTAQLARETLARGGVPDFAAPERAVEAFGYLAAYGRNQELLLEVPEPVSPEWVPDTARALGIVRGALRAGRDRLTTEQLRKLLATIGIRDHDTAGAGVRGKELCVSVTRDAIFGPLIRFGRGGGFPLTGEAVVALPPLNTAIIRKLVRDSGFGDLFTTRSAQVEPAVTAFERTLWALSELVSEVQELRELVLPSLVASGDDVYASGASASLCRPPSGAGRYDHMPIHPYPSALRAQWTAPDGAVVTARPIRPEDAVMEASFVRHLSDAARYFRFMVGLQELPRELLIRFTQIDYDRELALVALVARGAEQLQVGVARYVMTDPSTANVAIVVADEWQRKGIGKRLFEMLIDAARARGITRLEGEVLAENHAASALVKAFGFELSPSGAGDDLVVVEKNLV